MRPQELISIAISAGCSVTEYDGYFCVSRNVDVNVVVLVPKIPYIVKELVRRIRAALGL